MRFLLVFLLLVACGGDVATQLEPPAPTQCEPTIIERVVPAACEIDLEPEAAVPDGFGAVDEFPEEPVRAGREITARLVCSKVVWRKKVPHCTNKDEEQRRRAIYLHWKRRIKFASHTGKHRSKLDDGTAIHDRDRPAGWIFWERAVGEGWLTPESCAWHRVDLHLGHTAKELRWAADWPFTSSPLAEGTLRAWIDHSHGYEVWVARGPNDGSPAYMNRLMGDRCFDPAQWDRNDVSAYGHARKTMLLCGQAKADGVPCTYAYLRCTWGLKGRRRCARKAQQAELDAAGPSLGLSASASL